MSPRGCMAVGSPLLPAVEDTEAEWASTGHQERKQKHLDNQKEGKKRMKKIGNVELPQEAFYDILSSKAKK